MEDRRERTVQVSQHIEAIRSGRANVALMHQLACIWNNHSSYIHGQTRSERFVCYSENGQELLVTAKSGFPLCLDWSDLPTVKETISLAINQREHYLRQPCLIGSLLWSIIALI